MLIDDYFKNIEFIKSKKENMKVMSSGNLDIIDELSNFIVDNKNYMNIEEFSVLANVVVEFIEKFNLGYIDENSIIEYRNNMYEIVSSLEDKIIDLYDIKIFYYGKNLNKVIKSDFFKYKFIYIKNEKELKLLNSRRKEKKEYNILFVDNDVNYKSCFFDEILNINQIIPSMKKLTEVLYKKYYNLKYLRNSLQNCNNKDIESIIIGNSYSVVGIEEGLLEKNTAKLSTSSQDLYYSFEMAKKAILNNKNIKQCIFGISYYLLKHDLSKGESEYSANLIKNVYYPLLNDVHNSKLTNIPLPETIGDFDLDIVLKNILDIDKVEECIENYIYKKNTNYYNKEINPRRTDTIWNDFSKENKELIGLDRATQHNKLFKYEDTKLEYSKILQEFIEFMENRNIELVMVIFPTTEYYSKNILVEFKNEFNEVLEYIKSKSIKVIDLRIYCQEFNDSDFEDSDHLNELGAIKATNYIKSEIEYD